jgi:hypothetical protein
MIHLTVESLNEKHSHYYPGNEFQRELYYMKFCRYELCISVVTTDCLVKRVLSANKKEGIYIKKNINMKKIIGQLA